MGKTLEQYLSSVHEQLSDKGCYIVSDEFLADYETEEERKIRTTIWHAHIISHAQKKNHSYLAIEEAKILLDDLYEEDTEHFIKSPAQIELVLKSVKEIDDFAKVKNMSLAEMRARQFLDRLKELSNKEAQGDPTLDLSRGDYKICDRVFRNEVENAGFSVESVQSVGPIEYIGAISIYVLRK
ncbi:hypothetical protein IQ238_14400 [Pleurocapsales cyanobacterium LEGE 06147]|nr:hypothetical protein [Pleurocapsales cyanobacterium LEGE 06147]